MSEPWRIEIQGEKHGPWIPISTEMLFNPLDLVHHDPEPPPKESFIVRLSARIDQLRERVALWIAPWLDDEDFR